MDCRLKYWILNLRRGLAPRHSRFLVPSHLTCCELLHKPRSATEQIEDSAQTADNVRVSCMGCKVACTTALSYLTRCLGGITAERCNKSRNSNETSLHVNAARFTLWSTVPPSTAVPCTSSTRHCQTKPATATYICPYSPEVAATSDPGLLHSQSTHHCGCCPR